VASGEDPWRYLRFGYLAASDKLECPERHAVELDVAASLGSRRKIRAPALYGYTAVIIVIVIIIVIIILTISIILSWRDYRWRRMWSSGEFEKPLRGFDRLDIICPTIDVSARMDARWREDISAVRSNVDAGAYATGA
jgi:hypothetical protein